MEEFIFMDVNNVMNVGDVIIKRFEYSDEYVVIDINPDNRFVYIMNRLTKRCKVIDFMDIQNWITVEEGKFKIDISFSNPDDSAKEKENEKEKSLDFYKTEFHRINYNLDKIVNELHTIGRKLR